MRQAGSLLQARVAQEQHQQANAPPRKHAAIAAELSTERQARQMAERRIAELEAQMASIRTPAQRLGTQHSVGGQQTAQMLPRPLQMGARIQRPVLGGVPQMAPPTYSQVAQKPPRQAAARLAASLQAAPRSVRETQRRRDIRQGKQPVDAPRTSGTTGAAPQAQTPTNPPSGQQGGPEMAGPSHFSEDLRRYVSFLVQQYVGSAPPPVDDPGQATGSPVLDDAAMEEDRLAWQQIATDMRRSPDEDHPMLGGKDDVAGDDWESLDAEDFLMGEADPNKPADTMSTRQVVAQQPDYASVNRQTDAPAAQEQSMQPDQPLIESVTRQSGSEAAQRQLAQTIPVPAQAQERAENPDWQLVAARWWRQQRQQIQPQQGRLVVQTPQPRQQRAHPQRRMQAPDQWNIGESGEQAAPQQPSYRQRGAGSRGGRQVNPDPSEPPVQQQVNVEQAPQHPRLLNVGPKPTKWAGNTPLSAFKTDLILHYRATELPKQKWGIASIAFLSDACRTTFLSRLAAERGLQADPELVA